MLGLNILTFLSLFIYLVPKKKCENLKTWCPEIATDVDCGSPYIQTKCPALCNTCPGKLYTSHLLKNAENYNLVTEGSFLKTKFDSSGLSLE